ncbi:MAG TPA: 4-hydroxy-tetrahydrodipicolinate reductase [Candidatus Dormibacteraeota bacterium]|nr:4-hydroxy-tetrahydrodipicolinate reductase [Candidatus Dormibacteraeota bacterium]
MIRVAVAGALGRMGTVARAALREADGIDYAGGLARERIEGDILYDDLAALIAETKPDVLLDLTTYPSTVEISRAAIRAGVRPVIGATGWSDFDRAALAREAEEHGVGAILVPNFSLGAALMMRFAAEAARHFPTIEIVELHHDRKKDKPSGTALLTAERIAAAGYEAEIPIHSVRLRGLVAHHEVLLGSDGEVLTIRHDTLSREAFVAGMLAAVRGVMRLDRLVVGIDAVLEGAKEPPSA